MRSERHYLPPDAMAAIAELALGDSPVVVGQTALARRLGCSYLAVHNAVMRIRRAGGWYTPLDWTECPRCGQPFISRRGPGRRKCCPTCRIAVQRHQDAAHRRSWRQRNPDKWAAQWRRSNARVNLAWPTLPEEVRRAALEKLHEATRRDHSITLQLAEKGRGDDWTADEDQYLLEHRHEAARDVALALNRTLYGVYHRISRLRRVRARAGLPLP